MSLTNEVRKFQDDDFRAAVKLLEVAEGNPTTAIRLLERVRGLRPEELQVVVVARDVLDRLDDDIEAAKQLVIVTDSFREVLGIKPSRDETIGITAQDGAEKGVAR